MSVLVLLCASITEFPFVWFRYELTDLMSLIFIVGLIVQHSIF